MSVCRRTCASRKSETSRPILRTQRSSCACRFLPTSLTARRIRSAQLFKMLTNFVYGDAALLCGVPTQLQGRLDLFPEDSFQSVRQRFAQFQTEAHRFSSLLVSESHVAVTFFASHFPSKPGRRLEFSAADAVGNSTSATTKPACLP